MKMILNYLKREMSFVENPDGMHTNGIKYVRLEYSKVAYLVKWIEAQLEANKTN